MKSNTWLLASALMIGVSGCAANGAADSPAASAAPEASDMAPKTPAFASTYKPFPSKTVLLKDARVFDGKGGVIEQGDVLLKDGKIAAVGVNLEAPAGAEVINASGKWVTPGIIDVHSHLGVYPSPGVSPHSDGNEATAPVTAEVWAEHSVWPHDPGFGRALAGGVTSMQVLPGSANLVGGRAVTLKNVPSRTVQGMKFPDAPYGMKMACGENPKRVYRSRGPSTRMGNFAGYRTSWIKAQGYKESWEKYEQAVAEGKKDAKAPKRDLELETLAGVLSGDIIVHMHCYRGDEMVQVLDMAKEFDYKVGTFHHAVESYKIADILRDEDVCSAMWADWWGFKMESYDGIRENIPFVHKAGACAIVHSDSDVGIQHLNQEAAKALADGKKAGVNISKAEAWTWLSLNPAKSLGIEDQTGTLEPGKMADVVLWDGDPFSVYTRAEKVYVDGALLYDRNDIKQKPLSDFELGQVGRGDVK